MRDLVVREALRTMARDASKRFRELVAAGQQIPYDVHEPGGGSPLPQYVPLTERFIRDHSTALVELDSFGAGCAALDSADLAPPYLEEIGIAVPTDARRRGELAGIVFLCRLWQGSTDFSLDGERLNAAIAELEAGGETAADEIEVVVPLRGLQMPSVRLDLATATIVRADTLEVPAEARAPEGAGAAGWEPVFLAAARVSAAEAGDGDQEPKADAGARAVASFRHLITTLRLFKAGSVGLGPYAWTRTAADRWRRIATGAGRCWPGGYRLAEQDLADLAAFSRTLAYRLAPFATPATHGPGVPRALDRAISRFEAGLERGVPLEALNDYLLALRFLLQGGGPADLGLSMRVAALCAEPGQRGEIKAIVDRGLMLERELWSGEPAAPADVATTPAETTSAIEDLTRAILSDAACGHLGADLRSTADEILLADGLAVGEGRAQQRGGAEEWEVVAEPEVEPEGAPDHGEPEPDQTEPPDETREHPVEGTGPTGVEPWIDAPAEWEEPPRASERRPAMQVPEPGGRIRVESHPHPEELNVFSSAQRDPQQPPTTGMDALQAGEDRLAELLGHEPGERQRTSERVAYLFPRPEPTEWNVRELSYDRRRRSQVRAS